MYHYTQNICQRLNIGAEHTDRCGCTIFSCPRCVGVVYASPPYKTAAVKRASAGSQFYGYTSMPFALMNSIPFALVPSTMVNSEPRGMVTATVSSPSSSFPLFFSKGTCTCSTVALRGKTSELWPPYKGTLLFVAVRDGKKRKPQHVFFSPSDKPHANPPVVPDTYIHMSLWTSSL